MSKFYVYDKIEGSLLECINKSEALHSIEVWIKNSNKITSNFLLIEGTELVIKELKGRIGGNK